MFPGAGNPGNDVDHTHAGCLSGLVFVVTARSEVDHHLEMSWKSIFPFLTAISCSYHG